jgi:hypothetical protein
LSFEFERNLIKFMELISLTIRVILQEFKAWVVTALHLIGMLHLRAENTLYNDGHVARNTPTAKDEVILGGVSSSRIIIIIILHIRGAHLAIVCGHIHPLTWTILLHMSKSQAAVALNA